jgi:site-specific DNA-cytosine methylase
VTERRVINHFHMACGLGGGAMGFNQGEARVGNLEAQFVCIGGVDVDAAAIRDFTRNTGVQGTVLDLFDEAQYLAFHGKPPPSGWRPALPEDLHRAAHHKRPHIVFTSMPCKGFSGLLSEALSKSGKYQALNGLTLRSMWLVMEAWKDDPPELIVFENVPRISNRGRELLERITQLLRHYGYAVRETKHDCGELGGLAQSSKRFLMVARHCAKVPQFLYEPEKHALRAVGDVLGRMPLPGDPRGGPMHRLPALQWKTWVRLAFVEAGKDWRSLRDLSVVDGHLADYLLMPEDPVPRRLRRQGMAPTRRHRHEQESAELRALRCRRPAH